MEDNTPSRWHQKKVGIAILISGKINFKLKEIDKERQRWTVYNDKGDNSSEGIAKSKT